jgi:transketolase
MRELRTTFVETLMGLAEKDDRIMLLNDDTGFHLFEEFEKKFPNRYINCGIIEQSYMGIAAGLALSGKKPYVYGIIPFVAMRPYEQVRNDICYHNADVKIIGVGGWQYYKFLGFTHNVEKDEDIKIMKILPNMKVYTPKTAEETRKIFLQTYKTNNPAYIRL